LYFIGVLLIRSLSSFPRVAEKPCYFGAMNITLQS
jgi:hypothetical protein